MGPQWVHEIKHDGYRLIARKRAGRVRLFTRRGYDWTDRYPRIGEAVAAMKMMKLLGVAFLAIIVPAGASADISLGCFARVYDKAHLATHCREKSASHTGSLADQQEIAGVETLVHRVAPCPPAMHSIHQVVAAMQVRRVKNSFSINKI